jgi:beta-apo-4'-carotenal oxygenase
MADVKLAPFAATPMAELAPTARRIRTGFNSQKTKPLSYRVAQLNKLYWSLIDHTDAIIAACKQDLNKSAYETHMAEIDWCTNDIQFVIANLPKWMQDEKAPDIPLMNMAMAPKIRKDPLGAVLVLGCWNFPIQLSLGPLIGAIAAGCTAVLKPSEVSPACAMVLQDIVSSALDPECYAVVNGGVDETTKLLEEKWDKIFYTGNATVGSIIAKKAAETLTPVCLELGGRNPAIVTRNADPRLAARRLLWGKFHNAGQVCISQNYIMVDSEILDPFVDQLKIAMKEFFPLGQRESPDFGRIVNKRHFERIKKMIDSTSGEIIFGGETDEKENFIEMTAILVKSPDDSLIKDESFGPLMPILPVTNLDEAIRIANDVHATPLGLYPFGSKAEVGKILDEVRSGGASINDAFFHGAIPTLAFGGVGDSGQGAYRGKASFECFTHRRSVIKTPSWVEGLLAIRYPPYKGKLSQLQRSSNVKPRLDRQGRRIKGVGYWLGFVLKLGGEDARSALTRWVVLAAAVVGGRKALEARGVLPNYLK